jgi:hypothetical protein
MRESVACAISTAAHARIALKNALHVIQIIFLIEKVEFALKNVQTAIMETWIMKMVTVLKIVLIRIFTKI